MDIKISLLSSIPIYVQIVEQIKKEIINNKLEGYQLPSIRSLAKDLEIGIITVKKAYEQLANENYIYSKGGVGYFVNKLDFSQIKENNKKEIAESLLILIKEYKEKSISANDISIIFAEVLEGVYNDEN